MSEDLKAAIDNWNQAWLTKSVPIIEATTAEDYAYIGSHGQVLDRAAILQLVGSPSYRLAWGSWDDVSVCHLGSDSALVLDRFRGEGQYLGRPFKEDHRHTSVWVRREGRWQVRLEHCSSIAAD